MSDVHGAAAPAGGGEPTVADVMAFDPFAPPSSPSPAEPSAPAGSPEAATPGDAPKPGAGGNPPAPSSPPEPAKPGEAAATPAPATPPTPQPAAQGLTAEQIAVAIREAMPQPAQPAAPTQPSQPKFNLAIPPQILQGMRSDDPQEQATAVHGLVNGIANHLWNNMQQHLQGEYLQNVQQHFSGMLESQRVRQEVATDFYGTYPHLKNEQLAPLIQQAGMKVAQARKAAGKSVDWSSELRDEVAEELYKVLPQLRPAPTAATPSAGSNGKPKTFATGGGTRPAAPAAPPTQDVGLDLLS